MKKTPLLLVLAFAVAPASAQWIPWFHHDYLPAGSAALRATVAAATPDTKTVRNADQVSCNDAGDSLSAQAGNHVIAMNVLRDQMQTLELDRQTELVLAMRGNKATNQKRIAEIRGRYENALRAKATLMANTASQSAGSVQDVAGMRAGCLQTAQK